LPIIAALLKIIQIYGSSFVNYVMLFVVALQIIMIPAYPFLIAPIFNKYRNIHEFKDKENYMQVADRVSQLAKRLDFPLGRLWVMDGSTRSSHS
jgi:STE24 endopeptidase